MANKQNWFTRATIGAAMAENPAVMTAAGWEKDDNGDYHLDPDRPGLDNLRSNLARISTLALMPIVAGVAPIMTGLAVGGFSAYDLFKLGKEVKDRGFNYKLDVPRIVLDGLGIWGGAAALKATPGTVTDWYMNRAINRGFKNGTFQWGKPTTFTGYHASGTPVKKFKFPYNERWDVVNHGADPNGVFFTLDTAPNEGFLSKRPWMGEFEISSRKPFIQNGEFEPFIKIGKTFKFPYTKNSARNFVVDYARRNDADAIQFNGIADNQLQNQNILFATDKSKIKFKKKYKWQN